MARAEGIYDFRRTLQAVFIFGLALVALAACFSFVVFTRRLPWPTRGAVGGAILLVAFIAIRAASFHHFDHFIGLHWLGVRMNVVLEITGILLIFVLSAYRRATARVAPKPRVTVRAVPRAR